MAPAWMAVALQKTKRKAGSGPQASRRTWYWAPLAWYMPPSSAKTRAPQRAMHPATPQAIRSRAPLPVRAAVREGLKKMPTPMMAPITMQVTSIGPRTRAGWHGGVPSGAIAPQDNGIARDGGHCKIAARGGPPMSRLTLRLVLIPVVLLIGWGTWHMN